MVDDIIDIIRQCANGDGRAWKVFVKGYLPVAKNIIAGSFDLPSEAQDDIVQNVFLKLIRGGLEHFRGTSKYGFLKYFKTIVINETKSYLIAIVSVKGFLDIFSSYSCNPTVQDLAAYVLSGHGSWPQTSHLLLGVFMTMQALQ